MADAESDTRTGMHQLQPLASKKPATKWARRQLKL
jgi:hypothetical protein